MTIRLVLDLSALLGYASVDTALAVGEIVREVREGDEALRHDATLATFEPCQAAAPRLDVVDL